MKRKKTKSLHLKLNKNFLRNLLGLHLPQRRTKVGPQVRELRTNLLMRLSKLMIVRKLNQMTKMIWWGVLRNRLRDRADLTLSRFSSCNSMQRNKRIPMLKMMMRRKLCQGLTIPWTMWIYKLTVKWRICLSIFRDLNHKKLTWQLSWSPLCPNTYPVLEKLTLFWKCLNLMVKKKIWELLYWTNQR